MTLSEDRDSEVASPSPSVSVRLSPDMKELDLSIQSVQRLHLKTRDRKVAGLSKNNAPPTSLLPLYQDSVDHYGYRIHEGTGEGESGGG